MLCRCLELKVLSCFKAKIPEEYLIETVAYQGFLSGPCELFGYGLELRVVFGSDPEMRVMVLR